MAVSDEVRQVVLILEEEGFGVLAGELLTEISLGREIEKDVGVGDDVGRADDRSTVLLRVPIEGPDQLRAAMEFLRVRLVLPVRAFAEAEKIASEVSDGKSVRIRFIDPEERQEQEPLSRRDIGDTLLVDQLDVFLERLPAMVAPPSVSGV